MYGKSSPATQKETERKLAYLDLLPDDKNMEFPLNTHVFIWSKNLKLKLN
jgi:hypothetical protein